MSIIERAMRRGAVTGPTQNAAGISSIAASHDSSEARMTAIDSVVVTVDDDSVKPQISNERTSSVPVADVTGATEPDTQPLNLP